MGRFVASFAANHDTYDNDSQRDEQQNSAVTVDVDCRDADWTCSASIEWACVRIWDPSDA